MSFKNIKAKLQAERGFTIVELLIVIVVIGILAAITIVSYNGVTARANTASAQSAVSTVASKAEAYNADPASTGYPKLFSDLSGSGAAGKSYQVTGITASATAFTTSSLPSSPSQINFYACGTTGTSTAPANYAAITVFRGNQVKGWDYNTSAISTTVGSAGQTSGNDAAGFPIACFITAS
jgi:prepilin-type N-terminal cleavage/methylation domain-containing protein